MKKVLLLIVALWGSNQLIAQNWQSVNFPGAMVYTADTFQGKLCIGTGNLVHQADAAGNWTTLSNYNNSSNTPNKSKLSARNIDNVLYMGAKDFNSSGEGIVHTFDGTNITEKQAFRQFKYNGSRKVLDFTKANGKVYMATNDSVFYWSDATAKWEVVNKAWGSFSYEIKFLKTFKNKLVVGLSNEIFFYDGSNFDSLGFSSMTPTAGSFFGCNVADICIANDTMYMVGYFQKVVSITPPVAERGNVFKYYGTGSIISDVAFAGYDQFGMNRTRMSRIYTEPASSKIYVINIKNDSIGDVYLSACTSTGWQDLSLLVKKGKGLYPSIPGSELYDYNLIFAHQNEIFVGGRFTWIGSDTISGLAKFKGSTTGVNQLEKEKETMAMYPNPVEQKLYFETMAEAVSVYNSEGKQLYLDIHSSNELDMQNMKPGLYIVGVMHKGQWHYKRIMKN